jgi:hypothetical protein
MTTRTELMPDPVFRTFIINDIKTVMDEGMFDEEYIKDELTPEEVRQYSTYDEEDEEWYFDLSLDQVIELLDTNDLVFDRHFVNYEVKCSYINPDTDELYPEYVEVFKLIDSYLN